MVQACIDWEASSPDETLSARARDGVRSAFVVLLTRYQDRVYRLAMRMCHNAADAEEVTQETFILAHRGIASFHGESRFSTWLYRIAINQVLMRQRAARRRPVQSLETTKLSSAGWPLAGAGAEPMEGADEMLDRKVLTQRVRDALAQLDESHRAALVLRDLEELSAEDAANLLGISPDAVRQRAHRARLKLRELLGELVRAEPYARERT